MVSGLPTIGWDFAAAAAAVEQVAKVVSGLLSIDWGFAAAAMSQY